MLLLFNVFLDSFLVILWLEFLLLSLSSRTWGNFESSHSDNYATKGLDMKIRISSLYYPLLLLPDVQLLADCWAFALSFQQLKMDLTVKLHLLKRFHANCNYIAIPIFVKKAVWRFLLKRQHYNSSFHEQYDKHTLYSVSRQFTF